MRKLNFLAVFAALAVLAAPLMFVQSAHAEVVASGINGTMCLDANQSTNRVALWGCHGGPNQNFFGGYGQQRFGNLCLDAGPVHRDIFGKDSEDLIMAPCANKPSQRFGWSGGNLKNEQGYCLDVPFRMANQGTNLQMYNCNGGRNQMFFHGTFQRATPAQARLAPGTVANANGQPLGVTGNSTTQGGGGNIVAAGGGNIVAAGGGNIVAAGGGNIVAAGGGN